PAPCTPGHGDTVTTSAIRIAGVQVNLAGPARCQYDKTRTESFDFLGLLVVYIGADTAAFARVWIRFLDQVNGDALSEQTDMGFALCLGDQGIGNRLAGGI